MPASNIERWQAIYGDHARRWLSRLPLLVSDYAENWELTIHEPLVGGSVSVVIGASKDNERTVLKIHPPWLKPPSDRSSSAEVEAAAFKVWNGEGAPRLLAHDTQALLIEYIAQAEHAPAMSAEEVAALIAQVVRPISSREAAGIPLIYNEVWRRYTRAHASLHEDVSETLLMTATTMINYILGNTAIRGWGLIHGDLKSKNILKRTDGSYVVIDPNPAIGSVIYDAALWAIDKPDMLDLCEEMADYMKTDPQLIGSLAIALTIPEICLASPARARWTLEYVRDLAGTDDLESYFLHDFPTDTFMDRYVVSDMPDI